MGIPRLDHASHLVCEVLSPYSVRRCRGPCINCHPQRTTSWLWEPRIMCWPHRSFQTDQSYELHCVSWPCRSSCIHRMFHTLHATNGRPRLQAIHEDHFRKVVPDWPSDGPIVTSGSHEHVGHRSGGCSPTSFLEVHGGHLFTQGSWGPCINAMLCLPRPQLQEPHPMYWPCQSSDTY